VPFTSGKTLLQKPVADVIADIHQHRARKLIFVDANLISDREYALELFNALTPLKVQWYGLTTTLLAEDLPLLQACAKSGCRGLLMGLESISEANLRQTRKGFNEPSRYIELTKLLHEHGISLNGCFVTGFDEDTPQSLKETAELAVEARIDLPRFAVLTPFPGTDLFRRLEQQGRILTRNWELYDSQHVVFQPARMSVKELQLGTEQAWRHAYSYSSIARRLWHSPAPWAVRIGANLAYRYYGYHLHKFYNCDWVIGSSGFAQPAMAGA
jgi:radical SAM superfamily enzyme YgiQ (UPF0313 family)